MPAIDRGMVLVAEGGNGDIALLRLSLSSALAFDSVRPVLLAQLGWLLRGNQRESAHCIA
ncbi:hypothetical protein ABID19_006930 [Mesorhizobium robiniae]|uniref:Uncharacterized protein n=1 Tax=Mesorhizobium robiniae TaxID=559315 RepID=A0ABV2H011_9HYPH